MVPCDERWAVAPMILALFYPDFLMLNASTGVSTDIARTAFAMLDAISAPSVKIFDAVLIRPEFSRAVLKVALAILPPFLFEIDTNSLAPRAITTIAVHIVYRIVLIVS